MNDNLNLRQSDRFNNIMYTFRKEVKSNWDQRGLHWCSLRGVGDCSYHCWYRCCIFIEVEWLWQSYYPGTCKLFRTPDVVSQNQCTFHYRPINGGSFYNNVLRLICVQLLMFHNQSLSSYMHISRFMYQHIKWRGVVKQRVLPISEPSKIGTKSNNNWLIWSPFLYYILNATMQMSVQSFCMEMARNKSSRTKCDE